MRRIEQKRYKIYHAQRFDRELEKHDKSLRDRVDKIEDQLVENPYSGSPLSVSWFREKKYGTYRIYYLIFDDLEAVFMVALSEKKDQQKVINSIRLLLEYFNEEIRTLVKKENLT